MKVFFHKDAFVNWHNTNEHFTVNEFIKANCEYPGDWDGEIERIEKFSDLIITVVHVYSGDRKISCHVTSFIKIRMGKSLLLTSIGEMMELLHNGDWTSILELR